MLSCFNWIFLQYLSFKKNLKILLTIFHQCHLDVDLENFFHNYFFHFFRLYFFNYLTHSCQLTNNFCENVFVFRPPPLLIYAFLKSKITCKPKFKKARFIKYFYCLETCLYVTEDIGTIVRKLIVSCQICLTVLSPESFENISVLNMSTYLPCCLPDVNPE